MYRIVPASFTFDFAAEDIEQEIKKFIIFFYECNGKAEVNPEKEDEDLKNSKFSVRKKGNNDINVSVIESPKKSQKGCIKISPTKSSKYKNEANISP